MTIQKQHGCASAALQESLANGNRQVPPPILSLGASLIIECGQRSASATRKIAVAHERNPIPALP